MAKSVKTKIIERLVEILAPLKQQHGLRVIERKRTLFLLEPNKPALHVIIGQETAIVEDERGYTMTFPAMFKIILEDARDPAAKCDELEAWLQEKIEADEQLLVGGNALCSKITYESSLPFTEKEFEPDGGSLVTFEIEYRRMRAHPETSY